MYSIINNNSSFIINENLVKHFKDYSFLINPSNLDEKDYESKYKNYWRMNNARNLANNETFYKEYFKFIRQNIGNDKANINQLLKNIENTDAKFQFSFVSKAIHVINTNQPIFDVNVKRFYFLNDINSSDSWNEKVIVANKYYDFLEKEYRRITENELLKPTIDKLDIFLTENDIKPISTVKKIDSIIWAWVAYLNKGAIINEEIIWQ